MQTRSGSRRRAWWASLIFLTVCKTIGFDKTSECNSISVYAFPWSAVTAPVTVCVCVCVSRSCQSWSMRRISKEFRCSSLPTSRIWPRRHRPARSPRDSTCTPTGTASGRSRPAQPCLGKEFRYELCSHSFPHTDRSQLAASNGPRPPLCSALIQSESVWTGCMSALLLSSYLFHNPFHPHVVNFSLSPAEIVFIIPAGWHELDLQQHCE